MPDRNDPSQHETLPGNIPIMPPDFTGTINNDSETPVTPDYPTGQELADAPLMGVSANVLDEHLHKFFTAYADKHEEIGQRLSLTSGGGYVIGGSNAIAGINIVENADTPANATLRLYDGADASAPLILAINLAASESFTEWFLPSGLHYTRGLYSVVTGAIIGNVFTARRIAV
jgi:hypothetical protein